MNATGEMTAPALPQSPSRAATVLAVTGAVMQAGPFIGIFGTVLGMINAFHEMGNAGTGDPAVLSKAIGGVLIATAVGMGIGLVGLVLMLLSLVVFRCRQRWLVVTLVAIGVLWLVVLPGLLLMTKVYSNGTPIGPHI